MHAPFGYLSWSRSVFCIGFFVFLRAKISVNESWVVRIWYMMLTYIHRHTAVCALMHAGMEHIDGIVIQPLRKLSTVFFDSIIINNIKKQCVDADGAASFRINTSACAYSHDSVVRPTKSQLQKIVIICKHTLFVDGEYKRSKIVTFFDVRFFLSQLFGTSACSCTHSHMHFVPVEWGIRKRNSI